MTSPYEEGSPGAKIAIIAEAPGRNEVRVGRPLIGPSGELLEHCMHSAGVARRECYLTNVFEFEVVKDALSGAIKDQGGNLLWTSAKGFTELGEHHVQPALRRLETCTSNVIVPMGGTAFDFLYGNSKITKWRGSILKSERLGGRKLVPTIHPAASLRGQYIWRYFITSDFARAKEESVTPDISLPRRELLINPGFDDATFWLNQMLRAPRIAFDTEILNHQVSCISFCANSEASMCIPMLDDAGRHRWTEEQEAAIWTLIAQILGSKTIEKINQNILFDIWILFRQLHIHTLGRINDPMIAHHIIWPDFPKGLDFLCSMHTREPYYKDDGKLWSRPWADIERFWRYNARDSACAMECWDSIEPHLGEDYRISYEATIELIPVLLSMMMQGIRVDQSRLAESKKDVEARLREREDKLAEVAERPFNPLSPKQCNEYFYVLKGIKPYISRKTGNPTCDDQALARIVRRWNLPEARIVQDIRGLRKSLSLLEVQWDPDGYLRCSYNPRGTTTGRLSSSETIFGTGTNMQNLPPEFKSFLVADNE